MPTCWRSSPRTARSRHPARPRDYQLTDADARRLQRGGIRGWLDRDRVPEGPPLPPAGRRPDDARPRRRAGRDRPIACSRRSASSAGAAPASAAASAPGQELVGKTADGQAQRRPERGCRPGRGGAGPSAAASAAAAIDATAQPDASQAPLAAPSGRIQDQGSGASRDLDAAERRHRPGRHPAGARGAVPRRERLRDADLQPVHRRRALARPRPLGRRPARRDRPVRPPVSGPDGAASDAARADVRHRRDAGHGYTGDPRPRPVRTDPEACRWTA